MNSQVLRSAPRVLGAAALFTSLLAAPALAATDTEATVVGAACEGETGVTVVVDFTDTGGDVVVACAEGEQENGRAALEAAGFTPEDSIPGMICAIDSSPDPCPEEFDGNFWSYWFSENGDWESYMVGADDAEPAPGSVEGWRYSDGEEGPQVDPANLPADAGDTPGDDTAEEDVAGDDAAAEAGSSSSTGIWITVVAGLLVALLALYLGLTAQKRKQQGR